MGVSSIRELSGRWFSGTGSVLSEIHRALDSVGFTEAYVQRAISQFKSGRAGHKTKVVKDSVWGMVEIDPASLRLLDSPVVQRLRGIHQLGFSYLTYPSAEHTRFIHSLGMYCVVSRFLEVISRPAEMHVDGYDKVFPPTHLIQDLKHAAILHDVGHMPFSHATEKILEADRESFRFGSLSVDDFMFSVDEVLAKSLPLAECLSLAVILSPRFQDFYNNCVRTELRDGDPDAILRVGSLIVGLPPERGSRGIADLISASAVDADKVDYINRDSAACGIPVGIDVARLFLRSCFLSVTDEQMRTLSPDEPRLNGRQTIFVVNASGVDTVEELAQARASLYQRVYLHQTTRSAERLLARALESVAIEGDPADSLSDALELWMLDDQRLLLGLRNHASPAVSRIGQRLSSRQLLKRAVAFGRTLVEAPTTAMFRLEPLEESHLFKQIVGASLDQFRQQRLKGESLRSLETRILAETVRLKTLLPQRVQVLLPQETHPDLVTVLPMPRLENSRKDCIVLENDQLSYSPNRSTSDELMDAADIFKAVGYVLAETEWRELVAISTRTVFYDSGPGLTRLDFKPNKESDRHVIHADRRVRLDIDAVARRAGLRRDRLDELMGAAEEVGYFDDQPRLARAVIGTAIPEGVLQTLSQFVGQGEWRVTRDSFLAFVNQFPPSLRHEVIELLSKIRVLGRAALAADIRFAIAKCEKPPEERGFIAALTPDSGNFVRTVLDQEEREYLTSNNWQVHKSLSDALAEASEGELLMLCDDNVSSGIQSEAQFLSWFGIEKDQWPEETQRERNVETSALTHAHLVKLLTLRLAVGVCSGTARADKRLRERAAALGIKNFQGVLCKMETSPEAAALSSNLESFLMRTGSDVLAFCRHSASTGVEGLIPAQRQDCVADALGYDNARGSLSTIFNVPTSTLTALWCPGVSRKQAWVPLLMRRGYLKHLVLA